MGEDKFPKVDSLESDAEKGEIVDNVAEAPGQQDKNVTAAHHSRKLDLDMGEEHVRFRRNWWQLWSVVVSCFPQ